MDLQTTRSGVNLLGRLRGHLLDEGHDCRMVQVSAALIHESDQHLLHHAGEGKRDFLRFRGEERIAKVLLMKANAKAWLKVTSNDKRGLGVQHSAARQSALDGVEDNFGVDAAAVGENEGFGHCGDVASNDDLIGQLGHIARADAAGEGNAGAQQFQDWSDFLEGSFVSSHHDGKGGIDGLRFTSAHRRVKKLNAFLGAGLANLLRDDGANGTHVDQDRSLASAFEHAVGPEYCLLYFGSIGEHGDDDFSLSRDLAAGCGAFDALSDDRIEQDWNNVISQELVSGFPQIAQHGFAHDSETD